MSHFLEKGDRVRARILQSKKFGTYSLAGVQNKIAVEERYVEGVVTHIRGDHPTNPTSIGVWIIVDDDSEIVVDIKNILAILNKK
jgi:hypothetical protein